MNGLPISDILFTRDSTCRRNVAFVVGLSSWWRVSETRPGLSTPSRNYVTTRAIAGPVPSILVELLVSLAGRLLRLALSHTNCSLRGSHQATFSKTNDVICSRWSYLCRTLHTQQDSCSLELSCGVDVLPLPVRNGNGLAHGKSIALKRGPLHTVQSFLDGWLCPKSGWPVLCSRLIPRIWTGHCFLFVRWTKLLG